ncbi:IucA/IucC family protein [Acinetobacter baylyi]|uniref:Siderophore biosynthesis protein n=1 Tax=Acinetobacter baylyi (strain ATCC 33305 / BD413 / ADP1) TaxID=62977 RepID=Q6FAI5_ACIAD|nr:IucA/IucC family protein [Acinetobacter baylyi]ENV53863.1 hypothetical protein F952_01916 [Acinetobacter baylyi DSM 14961 = CIP 107474]KAF2373168.1 AcsC protein [Acinetobacter baylyi]KAF2374417.1 AcsC protein [Acinetobacter baylyi]KAF2377212.1 AcsC protein [Acinetobacter baylyi]KAF2381000.1 AcsC protein [Acinetobacter baylyi]
MGNLQTLLGKDDFTLSPYVAWQQPDAKTVHRVEQRVIKQLLQALIFENIVSSDHKDGVFTIYAYDHEQRPVEYHAFGQYYLSFGLVRLDQQDVIRQNDAGQQSRASLNLVLDELVHGIEHAEKRDDFIYEMKRTFIHDLQSQICQRAYSLPASQYSYEELETYLMEGHPYHPCYKSRVGFSLQDNLRYGVEFAQPIHLVWLAVHRSISTVNSSIDIQADDYLNHQLSQQDHLRFSHVLNEHKVNQHDYVWIPVHPWQWENTLVRVFFEEISSQQIIYLGRDDQSYVAQQSLRTLTNLKHPEKPYIKLSMSMINTSSSRILATHTAMNGPLITDWLQRLINTSEIAQVLDFAILREVHASAVDFTKLPSSHAKQAYGTIGSLWRESVHQYLKPQEQAIPLNGIGHVQSDNSLLIQPWLNEYGAEAWVEQLLKVVIQPILFLLYGEGIGSESHGQNIILVHRNGWPTRIILKDFHDGVRFSPEHLTHPEQLPQLHQLPAEHAKANRMSFILTNDLNAVRDMSCVCLFFVALSDIAIGLQQNIDFDEALFWKKTAGVIYDFQDTYPEYSQRFAKFNVFAAEYCVESLTKRRLFGDSQAQFKQIANPLYPFRRVESWENV